MASSDQRGRAVTGVTVRPSTLRTLIDRLGSQLLRREPIRVWEMSGVERLVLEGGKSAILKYAAEPFAAEPSILTHVHSHHVPVPHMLASIAEGDGSVAFVLEDLGEPEREADLSDAATAAVAVHECPPAPGVPVLDAEGLAQLPGIALRYLDRLRAGHRWLTADQIRDDLERLHDLAQFRAQGATIPPYGMCHSEFHPTSLHVGAGGLRILDWARAFTGPGLLDLVSWQGTPDDLDLGKVTELLDAYITAGGPSSAAADRGGLPAVAWAAGWHRLWIISWFLEQAVLWLPFPDQDSLIQEIVRRHLDEALTCLS